MNDKKNQNPAFPSLKGLWLNKDNPKLKEELKDRTEKLKKSVLASQPTSEEVARSMVKIGFDFDGTLSETNFFGKPSIDFKSVREFFLELKEKGFDVRIITRRFGEDFDNGENQEHQKVYELAELLGLDKESVHFTNRKWKVDMIHELGIHLLVDDDYEDCMLVRQRFSIYNAVCLSKEHNNDVAWRYGADSMIRFYVKLYQDKD